MKKIEKREQLISEIKANLVSDNFNLIAIDGVDGSGKTTIADYLSSELNIKHIELDDEPYLQKLIKGGYVDFIRYDILEKELRELHKKRQREIEKNHESFLSIENKQEEFDYSVGDIFFEKLKYHFKFKPDQEADIVYTWEKQ